MNALRCLLTGRRTKSDGRPARRPRQRPSRRTHHSPGPARSSRTHASESSQTQTRRSTWYGDLDQFNSKISVEQGLQGTSSRQQQQASPLHRPSRDSQPNTSATSDVDLPPASNYPSSARPRPSQASHQSNQEGPSRAQPRPLEDLHPEAPSRAQLPSQDSYLLNPKGLSPAQPRTLQGSHRLNPDGPLPASNIQNFTPPPSSLELDRLNHHRAWADFHRDLEKASNAVFSKDRISRYTGVDVILLSWQDEDPRLPVSLEIRDLDKTFTQLYGFDVEEYLIPAEDSHNRLQARILKFLGENDPTRLRIVYYGGHGKLTNHGTPAWTSARERCPTVKWSGIQNTLEESRSDVLILLDCCASGVCTTDEGNGATELIAACAYNAIANGVGPFSFTHALNAKLRSLAEMQYLNVGYLYNSIFTEVQSWRIEDSRFKKAPIHLILNQNLEYPRSIRLPNFSRVHLLGSVPQNLKPAANATTSGTSPRDSQTTTGNSIFSQQPSSGSSMSSASPIQEYPRLLFCVRIQEDINPHDLSAAQFAEWLRQIPLSTNQVRVEASFKSDSTLLMVSMPIALHAYFRKDPAIQLLGTIRSRNCLQIAAQETVIAEESLNNPVSRSQSFVSRRTLGGGRSRNRQSQTYSGSTFVNQTDEGPELSHSRIDPVNSTISPRGPSTTECEDKSESWSETDHPVDHNHEKDTPKKPAPKSKPPDYSFPPDIKVSLAPYLYQYPKSPPAPEDKGRKWTPPAKTQYRFPDQTSFKPKRQHKENDAIKLTLKKLIGDPEKRKQLLTRTDMAPNSISLT